MAKAIILLEDDWEIYGNGTGDVAYNQYLPFSFINDLINRFDIKMNFMVEVMQQLNFIRLADTSSYYKIQSDLWSYTIKNIFKSGQEIHLHIHPQWNNIINTQQGFKLDNKYNIGEYPDNEIEQILNDGHNFLVQLISSFKQNYKPVAFKAGSYALQPSGFVLPVLESLGYKYIIGPSKILKSNNINGTFDYSKMTSSFLPYHPTYDDICSESDNSGLLLLPLPYYNANSILKVKQRIKKHFCKETSNPFFLKKSINQKSVSNHSKIWKLLKPTKILFDINHNSFEYLKAGIDQILKPIINNETHEYIPVVLQMHSKNITNNYNDVYKLFDYLYKEYKNKFETIHFSELEKYLSNENLH